MASEKILTGYPSPGKAKCSLKKIFVTIAIFD
jgi:hypothetical protein